MKLQLAGDLSAPAMARDFVSSQLTSLLDTKWRWPTDDVVLVASELVTNAVQAGARSITVEIRFDAQRIDLEVKDDADGLPTPREADPNEVHGRGLAITALLSDNWTVSELHPAKVVSASWFGARGA